MLDDAAESCDWSRPMRSTASVMSLIFATVREMLAKEREKRQQQSSVFSRQSSGVRTSVRGKKSVAFNGDRKKPTAARRKPASPAPTDESATGVA